MMDRNDGTTKVKYAVEAASTVPSTSKNRKLEYKKGLANSYEIGAANLLEETQLNCAAQHPNKKSNKSCTVHYKIEQLVEKI